MKNAPAVKDGDRVRVVLEGDAKSIGRHQFMVGRGSLSNVIGLDGVEHVVSIEVLPKPLKVGDTIRGEAAYEALPLGAMLEPDAQWGEFGHLVRVAGGFIRTTRPNEFHRAHGAFFDPRVIAYLPEQAT